MTVRCPSCNTHYRLPPRSKLGAHPTFRCTRCDHVFATDEGAEPPALEAEPAEDDVETFDWSDEPPPEDEPPAETRASKKARTKPERRSARPEPRHDEPDDEPDDGPTNQPEEEPAAVAKPASTARFALRSMLAVVLGYGLLSIYLYTHPARVAEVLGGLPVIGDPLTETRLSPASIQLTDVHGTYERVHGDQLVFVIAGTATNNAPVPVSGVQIQGRIAGGGELRQTVFAGAAPRDVHDLSVREIDLLQTLTPPKEWQLAPGEQGGFLIAFVSPPHPLKDFSVEVVAVRRGEHPIGTGPGTRAASGS